MTTHTSTATVAQVINNIPAELKTLRRWVTWSRVPRDGKVTKPPQQRINDPRSWLSLAEACERVSDGSADGVGFVLGDGVIGIDLDGCVADDGTIRDDARDALALGSYAERSPSGRGIHILVRGTIGKSYNLRSARRELYDGCDGSTRYFTVTGDRVGTPMTLASGPDAQRALDAYVVKWFEPTRHADDHQSAGSPTGRAYGDDAGDVLGDAAVLDLLFAGGNAVKASTLYRNGDWSAYPSQSEADLALVRLTRFYTRSPEQLDRLFRGSALMRPKWDEYRGAQTYGTRTIAAAISKGGPVYVPRDAGDRSKKRDAWERRAFGKIEAWKLIRLGGAGELAIRVYGIIACYADKSGKAWPSIETIAGHCRVTPRRVKAALKKLRQIGVLIVDNRTRQSNLYHLIRTVPESITPYAEVRKGRRVTETGHLGCSFHGTVTNQEPTKIDTGEGMGITLQAEKQTSSSNVIAFPAPSIALRPSARRLRDEMLRGPVGELFMDDAAQTKR